MHGLHCYATDSGARTTVPLVLAGFGILSAWLFSQALAAFGLTVPWWVDAPSVLGFYGIYTQAFDRWLWRRALLHRTGLIKVPDLNGTWHGRVVSTSSEERHNHEATITIEQRWSRICIRLETINSRSYSQSAVLLDEHSSNLTLNYEYLNEPKSGATPTMQIHRGTARLTLRRTADQDILDGEYYTGRGRQTYGTICVQRPR